MQLEHTVEIKKIIAGGNGLGHLHDGMVVMVPFVLVGERVRVAEIKRFSGYIQAKLLYIELPSPKRVPPFCPQFTSCGGCALQHSPYPEQLSIKKEILAETLDRGHVLPEKEIPLPIASPKATEYRHTIRLHLAENGNIGFHRMQSNEIVPIGHCPLAAAPLNIALSQLTHSGLLTEFSAFCKQVELNCSPADSSITATLHLLTAKRPPRLLLDTMRKVTGLRGLSLQRQRKTTFVSKPLLLQQSFSLGSHTYTLGWDSRCFFQVNPEQNEQLVNLTLKKAGPVDGKKVLDLFCGMGNFSIPLALAGAEVTGIEHNTFSIQAAQKNAQDAGRDGCRFICGNVSHHLQRLCAQGYRYDTILLDPPRQGLGRSTTMLPSLQADKILYISCDPATLTRDVQTLTREGYRLTSVNPVDMFPQTHHIECLAVLEKN